MAPGRRFLFGQADLHLHSDLSDGSYGIDVLIRQARRMGLCCIALTDRDTIAGLVDGVEEALRQGMGFIPGVEISASVAGRKTVHILGYGLRPESASGC